MRDAWEERQYLLSKADIGTVLCKPASRGNSWLSLSTPVFLSAGFQRLSRRLWGTLVELLLPASGHAKCLSLAHTSYAKATPWFLFSSGPKRSWWRKRGRERRRALATIARKQISLELSIRKITHFLGWRESACAKNITAFNFSIKNRNTPLDHHKE